MKKSRIFKIFIFTLLLFSANVFTFAGDEFVLVRSKNFRLVGEASEEKVRREAFRLEQFREVVRRAFPELNVNAPVPTVILFKDSRSFAPFKPIRENGLTDKNVSGFFQSSNDANYIALPLSNKTETSSETLFHEYFHFLLKNAFQTTEMPAWLNEGLAEYYQSFRMINEQKAVFGEAQTNHLQFLRQYKMIPIKTLAAINSSSLARLPPNEKRLFYAQSWALVHFLMEKNGGLRDVPVKKYLALIAENKEPENAFEQTFDSKYFEVETRLSAYISKKSFNSYQVDFGEKLSFETHFKTEVIGEAEWLNYLGDLLFQSDRYSEAAELLKKSLALNDNAAANLSYGKILLKQGSTSEAATFFEKAITLDDENYEAKFYLADFLLRENLAADGYVGELPPERAEKIRGLLKKVIIKNPQMIEAYKMLALISLANDDEHEETIEYLQNALKIQPQNFRLEYNLAQLFLKQKNFEESRKRAESLSKTCTEQAFCERVKSFIGILNTIEQREKELAELRKKFGLENVDFKAENLLPPEVAMNRALNRSLRKPQAGEKRFAGNLAEIVCGRSVTFKVEGENQTLKLSKPSFDGVFLISYSRNAAGMRIECGTPKTEMFVVATFKNDPLKISASDGELLVLEFVPKEFKLIE